MEKRKKLVKILMVLAVSVACFAVAISAELLINHAYREIKFYAGADFVREGKEVVKINRMPVVKTEENNFAATILWATRYTYQAKDLTEKTIIEENNTAHSEQNLYNALDKYSKNGKREQVRNLTNGQVLEKIYESLLKNRAPIVTIEDGNGGVKYAVTTAYDAENATISVYDFEQGETILYTEADFLLLLKFENANADTSSKIIFGEITKNALMLIY